MISMVFPWKRIKNNNRRGGSRINGVEGNNNLDLEMELKIPNHFICPISLDVMNDPVTISTGITYDREYIEKWIEFGYQTCPVTNQMLTNFDLIPNHSLRRMIQEWCVENQSFGIVRIPTPRIPISTYEVSRICSRIEDASMQRDGIKCQGLVNRIKNLAKESERNKKCIIENGVGYVFASSFESFANDSIEKHEFLLKSILSGLTWMFPLGLEAQSKIGSKKSLLCIASFLNGEDLTAKQHAVIVLKELLLTNYSSGQIIYADILNQIEDVPEALIKILKVPICPLATKSALLVIYYMLLASSEKMTENNIILPRFLELGLVLLTLEMLVNGEKSVIERALGVLDIVCNWEQGRKMACNNALTMPLLVKKILRISDMATEYSVSILWKLCKGDDVNPVIDAMEVGGFQKLLVLLQVGCGEKTKEKVTELLKLMNLFKDRVDCLEGSTGFKYVKRPF